ncbi:MAG: hypothetical protein NVS2B3_01330 [Vulcanimicrobiaceae bacterium]
MCIVHDENASANELRARETVERFPSSRCARNPVHAVFGRAVPARRRSRSRDGHDGELEGYATAQSYGPCADGDILASEQYRAGLRTWYAGVDPDGSIQRLGALRTPRGCDW